MFIYLLICAVIIGGGYALHRYWKRKVEADLAAGAKEEYARFTRTEAKLMEGIDEAKFTEIYTATHIPRFPAYLLLTVAIFLVGTPIVLGLLAGLSFYAGEWGLIPQAGEVATDLYLGSGDASIIRRSNPETLSYIVQGYAGFYYFFGLLFFWLGVVYFAMRRYHRKTPGSIREEIMRSK